MRKKHLKLFAILLCLVFSFSCKDDPEDNGPEVPQADEINTFIWKGLNDVYLWKENVPNLTNIHYNYNEDSLNSFLNKYSDHEELFYDLLFDLGKTDKFSWIVDDYEELEKEFAGITKSMGYNFLPVRYDTDDKVFAYVRYTVKGSPAHTAGLKRGDIINRINGQILNINNYRELLYAESQNIGFGDIVGNTIVSNDRTASITAVEVTENPIYLDTVYTVGAHKIGYLIYNGFVSNYEKQLNDVFLTFKNEGITKLILDLRYNPGGSLETSTYLASMIHGLNTSKVFLKTQYNKEYQDYYLKKYGANFMNIYFEKEITNSNNSKTPINTLNLSEVYIITTGHTASASETIINGLRPYMNVVTVGTKTYGKYVGSITVKDYINNAGAVNPNHKWAMQPIVLKIANAAGVSDYVSGLAPDIELKEDFRNLSELGNLKEPLLSATVSAITGITAKRAIIPWGVKTEDLELRDLERKTIMYTERFVQ